MGHPFAYAAPAAPLPEGGQRRETGGAEQEQPLRELQFPLFRPRRRPQPQGVGAHASGIARHRRAQVAACHDREGQGLPACRARPVHVACPRTFQSRYGRADRLAGRCGALPGCLRRDARRTGRARPAGRGRHACHAVGLFDEHAHARHAVALLRRGYRRGPCRDLLGRDGRCGHGAFLQHLFVFHAAGLRQCDPRRRDPGSARGDVPRPGRHRGRGRRDPPRGLRHGCIRCRAGTYDRCADG